MRNIKQLNHSLKTFYRTYAPSWLRGSRLANTLRKCLYYFFPKSLVYDEDFLYSVIDQPASAAAPFIVYSIMRDLSPSSVLDVGCGSGAMLCAFQDIKIKAKGIEFAEPALVFCKQRNLDVIKMDLRASVINQVLLKYDVVLSMEVAEHLPKKSASAYVQFLCGCAPTVVFTAASPGQGGTDHLNEQPMEYWINLFEQYGFFPNRTLTKTWQREWVVSGKVALWYTDNLMIFCSKAVKNSEIIKSE